MKLGKPFFDYFMSFILIMIFAPILIVISICLLMSNNGNIFFKQLRPGLDGKLFLIIKFKTMNDKKDTHGNLLTDIDRMTFIGEFLRKSSLDELPQLINILKGEMSFIGPRPLLEEYLPLYSEIQNKRHDVKPGITGLAQVNGRNSLTWKHSLKYDTWYSENVSFKLDLTILFKTIKNVFLQKNINSSKNLTREKFTGNIL